MTTLFTWRTSVGQHYGDWHRNMSQVHCTALTLACFMDLSDFSWAFKRHEPHQNKDHFLSDSHNQGRVQTTWTTPKKNQFLNDSHRQGLCTRCPPAPPVPATEAWWARWPPWTEWLPGPARSTLSWPASYLRLSHVQYTCPLWSENRRVKISWGV